MRKFILVAGILAVIITAGFFLLKSRQNTAGMTAKSILTNTPLKKVVATPLDGLKIETMRQQQYPGSDMTIEQTLDSGSNYNRYIASYTSDGLKIYGLLTVPQAQKPQGGWPVIIFNHGYIPPNQYRTTERYVAYVDGFARNGYIVFKSDYRGNGSSEGDPQTSYYSPGYTVDVLNALASIKKLKIPSIDSGQLANPNKIGMWGHSMGGNITLRSLVVDPKDIKAAVIWGGVVGSYNDLIYQWHKRPNDVPSNIAQHISRLRSIMAVVGDPSQNPGLWNSIDPTKYVKDITAPIQLNHGLADEEVPPAFSQELKNLLDANHKTVALYEYPGSDHNISQGFNEAMQHSIEFFDKYLK